MKLKWNSSRVHTMYTKESTNTMINLCEANSMHLQYALAHRKQLEKCGKEKSKRHQRVCDESKGIRSRQQSDAITWSHRNNEILFNLNANRLSLTFRSLNGPSFCGVVVSAGEANEN